MRKVSINKVYKKKNGKATNEVASWYYRFERKEYKSDGSRNIAYKAGFKTKREAEEAGQKAYNIEYGIIPDPDEFLETKFAKMTFECYVKNHWLPLNMKMWKPTTYDGYRKKLKNYVFPVFGHLALCQITSEVMQRYFNDMYLYSKIADSTADNIRGLLSQIFKYAVNNLHLKRNPMTNIKKPNKRIESAVKKNKQIRDAIPEDIMERVFERFPEGTSAHIPLKLCLLAGLRISEALSITWDDVSFEDHCIYVRRQIQRRSTKHVLTARETEEIARFPELMDFNWYITNPKFDSKRAIPMCKDLEDVLLREQSKQNEYRRILGNKYVEYYYTKSTAPIKIGSFEDFNSSKSRGDDYEDGIMNQFGIGYRINFVNRKPDGKIITESTTKHVARVVQGKEKEPAIYEDFNVHSLRHTFASKLRSDGYPEHIVQDLMGHKSPVETKTYMHIMNDEFRTTVRRFSKTDSEENVLLRLIQSKGLTEEDIIKLISEAK